MVVPAGGAWLALHVLLLLAATPRLVSMAQTSPSLASSWSGHDDNVTAYVSSEEQRQQQQQQADMPAAESYYPEQEDIQVGCRELRAKRYISDGFCTSTKPIKEVVCAGNCLPIRDLPWYAEFVKVWAKSKLREWQCEEDIVRRKTVSLLCRNGDYRTYRIKVVKSCKCKRMVSKHNRTAASSSSSSSSSSGEGGKKKKNKKKRKKDRRRRGRKNRRRGEKKKNRREEREEEEEVDVSQDQRQESSNAPRKERRRNRKRPGRKGEERNSEPVEGLGPLQDSLPRADSDRHKAVADPSR